MSRVLRHLELLGGKVELSQFHWLLSVHIRERVYYQCFRGKTIEELDAIGARQGKQESYRIYANMIGIAYEDVRKCIKIGRWEQPEKPSLAILSDMKIREKDEEYTEDAPTIRTRTVYMAAYRGQS